MMTTLIPPSVSPKFFPAKLNVKQVGELLGFEEHEVRILVSEGLLPTLGNPAKNAHKYFAFYEIQTLAQDRKWLHKATKTVYDYWNFQNARKKTVHSGNEETELAA